MKKKSKDQLFSTFKKKIEENKGEISSTLFVSYVFIGVILIFPFIVIMMISEDHFPYDMRRWLDENLPLIFWISVFVFGSIFAFFKIIYMKPIDTKNKVYSKEMFVGYEPYEDVIKCPKCRSTQITAGKKGFSLGKAAAGGIATGGIGLLAGFIGSGKVRVTCLKCGHSWTAGKR